jgi:hypothetical protein
MASIRPKGKASGKGTGVVRRLKISFSLVKINEMKEN